MKRILGVLGVSVLCGGLLLGCGKKEEAVSDTTPKVTGEVDVEKEEGGTRSLLTGEAIDEAVAKQRPLAIMIGNTNESGVLPQSGIGSADVIYEVPVEGELTRLMGIFQDYQSVEKIESIRSCRLYFLDYAKEFDAIYAHWGEAHYATESLNAYDDLDGKDSALSEVSFFRDANKSAPHNGYATGEGIAAGIASKGYRTDYDADFEGHYTFAEDDEPNTLEKGVDAVVAVPGYTTNKASFVYDPETKTYARFEYGAEQTDALTGEQVKVTNIIFEYTECQNADENGYLAIDTTCGGSGKFITNGKAIDITWTKDAVDAVTHYYDAEGNEITLNQGKTWVSIIKNNYAERAVVYASEEEYEASK